MRNELPKRYPMFSFVPSFSFFYHCLSSHLSRGISFALAGQVSSGRRLLEKIMSPEDCDCFRAFRVSRRLGRTNEATRDVSASGSPFLSYGDKMNDTHRFPDRAAEILISMERSWYLLSTRHPVSRTLTETTPL